MERDLTLDAVRIVATAAAAAAPWRGKGDKNAADDAAVTAMRDAFRTVPISGTVRIGEGEMDEAPMLYIGERLGTWDPGTPTVDIAVDPLEGTALCARGAPGAVTTVAFAERGWFLHAPDVYMEKIAVGPAARGVIDIRKGATWNLSAIAEAKRVAVGDLGAVILNRPRHAALIAEVHRAGARVELISDGDLMAAATTALSGGCDVLFGIGGAPEGVLAAAALRCLGGDIQGVLRPETPEQAARIEAMTGHSADRVYGLFDLAAGNITFAAAGVTRGPLLRGVRVSTLVVEVQSIVMRSSPSEPPRTERMSFLLP